MTDKEMADRFDELLRQLELSTEIMVREWRMLYDNGSYGARSLKIQIDRNREAIDKARGKA
jgi:hypothetical protein